MNAIDFLIKNCFAITTNEAKRLIIQGCIRVNGKQVIVEKKDNVYNLELELKKGDIVKVGKRELTL